MFTKWSKTAAYPKRSYGAFSFTIGDFAYVGGGWTNSFNAEPHNIQGHVNNDFYRFNPDPGIWEKKASLPVCGRAQAAAFSINGKGYVGTGFTKSPPLSNEVKLLGDFWEYDPIADIWAQVEAAFPDEARSGAFAFSIGNKGYVGFGGVYSDADLIDFWEFDGTKWTRIKVDLEICGRSSGVGFEIDGKGYFGLGGDLEWYEFIPPIGNKPSQWNRMDDLPIIGASLLWGSVGFRIGNNGCVGTGSINADHKATVNINQFWSFDPKASSNHQWKPIPPLPIPMTRYVAVGFGLNGTGFIGTGQKQPSAAKYKQFNDFWRLD